MSDQKLRGYAQALFDSYRTGEPIEPLSETDPSMEVGDAHLIQKMLAEHLQSWLGGRMIGYKLGLTSEPMQKLLGVDTPDFAPVISTMTHNSGERVDIGSAIAPKAEAEITLMMGETLRGPGVTALEAARAVEGAVASIEVVDSRVADWRIKLVDTVADLGSSRAAVLGDRVVPVDFDLRWCGMAIYHNGGLAGTGAGAACMGSPLIALAWLANELARYDQELEAGSFVLTGALHSAFPVKPGDNVWASFDRLGSVSVNFC
ncbi:MAG: fumarylacetoacetate hydrolase family protein [Actinomycetia bacterium]|nr:fumarylacetoacetate hydrolase family protein [Actinomycetes bacterium]